MAIANISDISDKYWYSSFVAFKMTMGKIEIELYWKHVPII